MAWNALAPEDLSCVLETKSPCGESWMDLHLGSWEIFSLDRAWTSPLLEPEAKRVRNAVFHVRNFGSAEAKGSKGGRVRAMRTKDKSHLGRTEDDLGLSLRKERSRELMAESCVISFISVCLKAEEMADL